MHETILKTDEIFKGRILTLNKLTVSLPDGREATRECVDHAPAVVIVPFQAPDTIYLIRQYRVAVQQTLIEVPAGCLNADEDPLVGAKRELQEETGFTATDWIPICEGFPSPGFSNELMTFYIAKGLTHGETHFDEDENIELFPASLTEAMRMIKNREIIDLKSILGITFLQQQLMQNAL